MERGTTLFLKITVILMGIPIVALCVVGLPMIIGEASDYFPSYWLYPTLTGIYASAIPYFIALYQALRLLRYIDKNVAFSDLSVIALKNIKKCAFSISILYAAVMPFVYLMAEMDDAPGMILMGLVVIFASIVIGAFAAVLQKLLKHAIDIKSENDLTI